MTNRGTEWITLTNERRVLPGCWHHEHVQALDLDVGGLAVRVGPGNLNGEILDLAVHASATREEMLITFRLQCTFS